MENVTFPWFLGRSRKANIEYYGGRRAKVELSGVVLEARKLPNVTYIVIWVILESLLQSLLACYGMFKGGGPDSSETLRI